MSSISYFYSEIEKLLVKPKAIKAGPKIAALLRRGSGPTLSTIGEKLKSTKVSIQKNSKVANYASVPLVMEVEL
ncbi:hypothetical protein [Clostridium senegalense]|uniref:hypothetical protein n=1 Tax=Clostridium senegalense TaxID=1465809 RepID=UPI0018FE2E18|nr:hypothetical protein [Clostridium senegalense]